jgi:hypothetical protein
MRITKGASANLVMTAFYQDKMPIDGLYHGTAFECGFTFEEYLRLGITKFGEFRIQIKG